MWTAALITLCGLSVPLVLKHWKALQIIILTLPRDLYGLYMYIKINLISIWCQRKNYTTAQYFDIQVKRHKDKPCFYYEDEVWTYEKMQKESYKVANYFQSIGYKKGDCVALIMENRPEYVRTWLGLSRIGVVTALINYNVRLKGLQHCVTAAKAKALIFGTEMTTAIQEVIDVGGFGELDLFSIEDRQPISKRLTKAHVDLSKALELVSAHATIAHEPINFGDMILLIYTSGTTGLPKACYLRHSRVFQCATGVVAAGLDRNKDKIITPVPLYHLQGGILGVGAALLFGIPVVILRKFSASRFWEQCIKYEVTASQYLGEIIRYLLNQPEKDVDKKHGVKIFFGNGVNGAIWEKFVRRFNNLKIKELYGATEGNCNTMNLQGHVGACGYMPNWAFPILPFFFAKVDDTTGELIRDPKTGLVVPAKIGEPGELLGKILAWNPFRHFDGYTDKAATEKKIAENVRKLGDQWFRTGDLLLRDEYGYWYFKDRAGDTFRWKGENVSTAEVEEVVTRAASMKGTVVFGVAVPGTEGKCGMACIADPENTLDLKGLGDEINRSLPAYARPLFIRVSKDELDMTGTFKLQKIGLSADGFNINKVKDPIYFLKEGKYVPLNETLYNEVVSGQVRL